jgi:hypothetical protein
VIIKTKLSQSPSGIYSRFYLLCLGPLVYNTAWIRARLCKLQKRCSRLAAAFDKVYQLLAHGRLFSPGTQASSTTKTGRHDIAEILLKVALSTKNQINQITISLLVSNDH